MMFGAENCEFKAFSSIFFLSINSASLKSLVGDVATVQVDGGLLLVGALLCLAGADGLLDLGLFVSGTALGQFFNGHFLVQITGGVEEADLLEETGGEVL